MPYLFGLVNLQNFKHTNKRFDAKKIKENRAQNQIGQGWEGFK